MKNITFKEFILLELQDTREVNDLEKQLDNLFADLGIDIEFSRHFIERILGREQSVTEEEIKHAFSKLKEMHGDKLVQAKEHGGMKAALKDFQNSLNIVFELDNDSLTNVTIMRKSPNSFKTSNFKGQQELKVW